MSVNKSVTYPVFSALKISLGIFGGSVSKSKSVNVSWDGSKTSVTSASLSINAHVDWTISDYIIHLNGNEIYRKDFGALDPLDDILNLDIVSFLKNGVNDFVVTFEKPLAGATLVITVILVVEYTGEEPNTEDTYFGLTKGQIIVVGVGVGGVGLYAATKKGII